MRGLLALRDAFRSLRSTPAVTAFVLAVLTLSIAAATVTFSVVDAVILRPLPYADPDRIAVVTMRSEELATFGAERGDWALPVYLFDRVRERTSTFSAIAAVRRGAERLGTEGDPEPVVSAAVTAELFDVLGVRPMLGTPFTADHEVQGSDLVAVIDYGLWQRHFGGDRSIVGKPLRLASRTVTVLGVMPPGFSYPLADDRRPELWTPFVAPQDERSGEQLSQYLHVVGRLAAGVSIEAATDEANALLGLVSLSGPSRLARGLQFAMRPLADTLFGAIRGWMLLVLAGVVLVMLIACATVANMQLARATRRARELAVRASLGASRRRLAGSMIVESLVLSLTAAALGVLLAVWGVGAAKAALPATIARASDVALDLRVLIAAVTAAIATGLIFGSVPAWQASRHDLVSLLKDASPGVSSGRARWRSALLIAEVAFVTMLLVATTLFVGSFVKVVTADLGFERRQLLVAEAPRLTTPFAEAVGALERVPGVAKAGAFANGSAPLTIAGGFGGGQSGYRIWRPGTPVDTAIVPLALRVSPGYFAATGMPVLRGRDFTHADTGAQNVIVLDVPTARHLFGDRNPVGGTVLYGADTEATVVGVVPGVFDRGPEAVASPHIYMPMRNDRASMFVVRTRGAAVSAIGGVTAVFDRLRPAGSPPARVRPMDDAFRNITANRRFAANLMSLFGVMAAVIGAAGIFGVMASIVAQRRREFGIRIALGASGSAIMAGVLHWAGRHLAVGVATGLLAAALTSQGFASLFFGLSPADAWIYAVVAAAGVMVGLAAAVVPARRAARVDPLTVMRTD